MIKHDIQSKQLEAREAVVLLGENRSVVVGENWLNGDQSFYGQVLDTSPSCLEVFRVSGKIFTKSSNAPFAATIVLLRVIIEKKLVVMFVQRVVCQVHTYLFQVIFCWRAILFRAETSEAFFVDEYTERITGYDQHVYSQVKLHSVNQIWLGKISLRHDILTRVLTESFECSLSILRQAYSLPLATTIRLQDERLLFLRLELRQKLWQLYWQVEALRHKLEVVWKKLGHLR
mmetsp:Transcript_33557/g.40547  ORF Transcript_33557/g.40547 Transcript_33557/m.40547 type:complete len:231 (-) Transcript_33557:480-1172(-)